VELRQLEAGGGRVVQRGGKLALVHKTSPSERDGGVVRSCFELGGLCVRLNGTATG
jgi:hypothetical protein